MSYEQALIESENNALEEHEFVSNVNTSRQPSRLGRRALSTGIAPKAAKSHPILSVFLVIGIAILGIFVMQFDEEVPSLFNDLIIEATDVQNADHIESSKLVFEEALRTGNIPNDTASLLKEKEYQVGYLDENGNFIEDNKSGKSSVLKKDSQIISADDFIQEINSNVGLYDAFKHATYDKAAYYYDEAANKVFEEIDASRNEFQDDTAAFDSTINEKLNTKNIKINNVERKEETKVDEDGNEYTVITYEKMGNDANTKLSTAESIVEEVIKKNTADTSTEATLMAADELKVADTISKERRSMSFYTTFMENISKMKAGEGQNSKINDAMNFLHDKTVTQVLDVTTGQMVDVKGSPVESPSLNAILMGRKVNINETAGYSSDRILNTTKNQLNLAQAATTPASNMDIISSTVASFSNQVSNIGRLIESSTEVATAAVLAPLTPTISSSLIKSSLDNMNGIAAGEFLVEGAVNLGRTLAVRGSGATAGDSQAIIAYQKLNNQIIAMDAAADRLNRSPFDITSKNTFLGSIVYKFATMMSTSSIFSGIKTLSSLTSNSILALFPTARAAEEANSYLSTFGQCETYATIGAVGTAQCSSIATFDTSTLDNLYSNQEYINFLNENTVLKNGQREVKSGSFLAKFIDYNNKRSTPLGTTDASILKALRSSNSILDNLPIISDILSLINLFKDATEEELRLATGAAFVNSSSNPDWQKYKYAQRYISMSRAVKAMRQFSSDPYAYNNLEFHEGTDNPIMAYMYRDDSSSTDDISYSIASTGVVNEN